MDKKRISDHNLVRKTNKYLLSQQIDELFAIMDGLEGAVYVSDIQTYEILRFNKYIKELYGENLIGKKCYKVFQKSKNKPCSFCTNSLLMTEGRPAQPVVWDYQNSRTGLWYHCIDKAIHWPDGRYVRMEIAIDITERKIAEIELRESERFYNTIFESINDPFNIIDSDYRIIKANKSYLQMRKKSAFDLIGRRCYEVLHNKKSICEGCLVRETFSCGRPCSKEKLVHLAGISQAWVEIYTYPIFDKNGIVSNVIEYTRDVTERKRAEAERNMLVDKLQYMSRTDDLTGLLNRRAIIDKLQSEIRRTKRYGAELSLIICDIDYFKEINDTYGHDTGDRVLQMISNLIEKSLRNTDIIGRYGGDEFLLILPETSLEGAKDMAERIREVVRDFIMKIDGKEPLKVTVSLGVAEYNAYKEDINDLIKRADNALYMAKGRGRDRVYIIRDNLKFLC